MTLKQFGQLVKQNPKIRTAYGNALDLYPDEFVADKYLLRFPQYWSMISPAARRVRNLIDAPIETDKGFFDSWADFYANDAQNIANRRAVIQMVAEADVLMEASSRGLTVQGYEDIVKMEHVQKLAKDLEQFRRDNGLDGADRSRLTPHNLIQQLEDRLMRLIDRRDAESHPDKRSVLSTRIKHLQEELDARGQQAVVSAGGGSRMGHSDEDPDGPGGSQSSQKGNLEPVSPPKSRMGF